MGAARLSHLVARVELTKEALGSLVQTRSLNLFAGDEGLVLREQFYCDELSNHGGEGASEGWRVPFSQHAQGRSTGLVGPVVIGAPWRKLEAECHIPSSPSPTPAGTPERSRRPFRSR